MSGRALWRQITATLWRDEKGREIDAIHHPIVLRSSDDRLIGTYGDLAGAFHAAWLDDVQREVYT